MWYTKGLLHINIYTYICWYMYLLIAINNVLRPFIDKVLSARNKLSIKDSFSTISVLLHSENPSCLLFPLRYLTLNEKVTLSVFSAHISSTLLLCNIHFSPRFHLRDKRQGPDALSGGSWPQGAINHRPCAAYLQIVVGGQKSINSTCYNFSTKVVSSPYKTVLTFIKLLLANIHNATVYFASPTIEWTLNTSFRCAMNCWISGYPSARRTDIFTTNESSQDECCRWIH